MQIKNTVKKLTVICALLTTMANCAQTGKITKKDSELLGRDGVRTTQSILAPNRKLSQLEVNQQMENVIDLINIASNFIRELSKVKGEEEFYRIPAEIIKKDIERLKKEPKRALDQAERILLNLQKKGYTFNWLMVDIEQVRKEIDK